MADRSRRWRPTVRLVGVVAMVAAPFLVGAAPAAGSAAAGSAAAGSPGAGAQVGTERIVSFDSTVELHRDGGADITEVIVYDFGYARRHGIVRKIPTVFPWTGAPPAGATPGAQFDRVLPITDVEVSASGDTPADVERTDEAGETTLRIGDPDRTITGEHTYTVRYHMAGVLNSFPDHDELYLEITGHGSDVPVERVTATVTTPGSPSQVACYAGPVGSRLACASATSSEGRAVYAQEGLGPHDGLTALMALPKGVVTDPSRTMILRERWSFPSAFRLTPSTGTAGGALLACGLGLVALMGWRNGRDRRYAGSVVDAAFGNATGDDGPVPLFDRTAPTVEFVPPDGIRPGHLGTLWDEQANHLDVSAMIVDLAVRGWLRIDELAPESDGFLGLGGSGPDYRLVRLRHQFTDAAAPELLAAESALLESLFDTGDEVLLSELKTKFATKMRRIQSKLYDDAVDAGWFPVRPDKVRSRWFGRGLALLLVGAGAVVAAAVWTHLALVAVPLPILGLVLMVASRWFPRRTARGTALLGRVRGFKELFDAGEGDRQRFAEEHHLFAQYLPYAIVFGCTEKWAETFAGLGLSPEEMGYGVWYTSPYGYDPIRFGHSMSSFTTTSSGTLAAAAPSSSGGASSGGSGFSGGFSGGGFGGGSTGSW